MKNNEDILSIIFRIRDSIEYEINENGIVVVIEKQDHKIQRFLRKLRVKIPMYRKVTLDEYSSEVFTQIDGKKTVKEIGESLEDRFGEKVHPLYERLLMFLNHIDINCKYIEKVRL